MDGKLLNEAEPSERLSYTQRFEAVVPYYMSLGMTPDEFWQGDPQLAKWYRESYRIRRDRKNQEMWIQGMYIYEALCDASPLFRFSTKRAIKPVPYPKEPYQFSYGDKKEDQEKSDKRLMEKGKQRMENFMLAVNAKYKKGGIANGESGHSGDSDTK